MTHPLFQKTRLATAIALISSSALISGCNLVDGDSSTSSSVQQEADRIVISQQQAQKAQIVGVVQDTNGNAVADATVSIGIATVKTNANGVYYLKDIPVTGLQEVGGVNTATPLEISIVPANSGDKKYLTATVSVTPNANTIIQTQGGADNNDKDSLIAYITQDGLAVSAGVTVIPALKSTVIGVLRDAETGLAVANAVIGLEVLGVNGVDQQQTQNTLAPKTSYGVGTYQAATNANGEFEFTNLPVDTEFDLNIDNWKNPVSGSVVGNKGTITMAGFFATTNENTAQNIGDIEATYIGTLDNVDPFVLSVSEVHQNAATGLLKDNVDGTQGLTINFSEPVVVQHINDSIYIKNNTKPEDAINVASAALSADGKTLTITTAAPIAEGVEFSIFLNRIDYRDTSGNNLGAGPATFKDETIALYDSNNAATVNTATGAIGTLELNLKTYARPIMQSGQVVSLQQELEDGLVGDFEVLQNLNKTFIDIDSGSLRPADADIEQLNAKEAAPRLSTLANATYAGISGTAPTGVSTTTARVRFTLDTTTPSRDYVFELRNSNGTVKALNIDAATANAQQSIANNNTNQVSWKAKAEFNGDVDLIIKAAAFGEDLVHGDKLVIGTRNSLDVVVAQTEVVLEDKIAPTTVIQNNYGLGAATSAVVDPNYGDGGELANNGLATVGTPLFNVTARLLTPQVGNVPLPVPDTWKALTEGVDRNTAGAKQVSDAGPGLAGYALYDKAAWAAWNADTDARTRNVGIAFSEDITLTATAPTFSGTGVTLSDWAAQNNVLQNDQTGVVNADLVNVKVSDVVALANNEHNSVIDFTGAVKDAHGNSATADNNAKVVVRDRLAPLPTSAVYNGDNIVVTFNEDLGALTGTSAVDLEGLGFSLNINGLDQPGNANVANNTLTINAKAWGIGLNRTAAFSRGAYDDDNDPATLDSAHGALKVDAIADTRGNTWNNSSVGVDKPAIVIRDNVGAFGVTPPANTIAANGQTTITLTFTFSHRIDPTSLGFALGDNQLPAGATAALFNVTGPTIDTGAGTATKAVLNANGRTLTVTLQGNTAFANGNTIDANPVGVFSAWDTSAGPIPQLFSGTITVN